MSKKPMTKGQSIFIGIIIAVLGAIFLTPASLIGVLLGFYFFGLPGSRARKKYEENERNQHNKPPIP